MWLISEILPLGSLFTNVFFFFPGNVIMARLEFIKLVLHCIEQLSEKTNTLFTQGLIGFSVHLSDNVSTFSSI